jgi:hypothetical protein
VKPTVESSEPAPERLQIVHLLFWTAMTAMVLGIDRATSEPSNGELGKFPLIMAWGYAPLIGAGFAAWVLMFWRIWNEGPLFPAQPGHWLLLVAGIGGAVQLSVRMMIALSAAGAASIHAFLGIRLLGTAAAIFVYSLAIREAGGIWRTVFWLGMVSNIASLLLTCVGVFQVESLLAWLLTAVVLIAAVVDYRAGARRDYLHWLGIFVRVAYVALMTAIPFLIRWLQRTPVTP